MKENTVLTENAYNYILDQILEGNIRSGDRIREDIIAEELGMSRTPVREAVNQLSQNGFIHYVKRKGLYCVKLSREEMTDLLELRQVLEEYSYIKCAERASKADIAELYAMINNFQAMPKEEKMSRHIKCDIRFHIRIAEISNSQRLIKYINEIETLLLIVRKNLKNSNREYEVIELSWDLHYRLIKAVEAGDKQLIRELNHDHVKLMQDTQLRSEED